MSNPRDNSEELQVNCDIVKENSCPRCPEQPRVHTGHYNICRACLPSLGVQPGPRLNRPTNLSLRPALNSPLSRQLTGETPKLQNSVFNQCRVFTRAVHAIRPQVSPRGPPPSSTLPAISQAQAQTASSAVTSPPAPSEELNTPVNTPTPPPSPPSSPPSLFEPRTPADSPPSSPPPLTDSDFSLSDSDYEEPEVRVLFHEKDNSDYDFSWPKEYSNISPNGDGVTTVSSPPPRPAQTLDRDRNLFPGPESDTEVELIPRWYPRSSHLPSFETLQAQLLDLGVPESEIFQAYSDDSVPPEASSEENPIR